MSYVTAKQLSEKWGITERRIIKLCKEERISGAIKNGMVWMMPEDTMKPVDKRNKVAKYINIQKRILITNINSSLGYQLIPLLEKEGYRIDGTYDKENSISEERLTTVSLFEMSDESNESVQKVIQDTEKYYEGLIMIEPMISKKENQKNKENFMMAFAQKMNCESSIILIENTKTNLEVELAGKLKSEIGIRINTLQIEIPNQEHREMYQELIAEDVVTLLTKFKHTTGMSIKTNGGYLEFDKEGRTKSLEKGKFYQAIQQCFSKTKKGSTIWCASTMLEDEWTEEPAEMLFRVTNLEAANRGVKLERIFIFPKSKIKEFKNNKTLNIYMQSPINTMYVDYEEIKQKEPALLEIVGQGWDGIDLEILIADSLEENQNRGYLSINKKEIQKAYHCFTKLKQYAKDLKEILK